MSLRIHNTLPAPAAHVNHLDFHLTIEGAALKIQKPLIPNQDLFRFVQSYAIYPLYDIPPEN